MTIRLLADTFAATKLKHMDSAALVFAILHEIDAERVDDDQLRLALELATAAHLSQTRIGRSGYPVDPYIVHPLRNTLRLIRLGCADTDVLSATALHDTAEDQPKQIVSILTGDATSADSARDVALALIAEHLTVETSRLVAAVTNPPSPPGLTPEEKNAAYAEHVASVLTDPKVFLVKYADFVDNAGSVKYLDNEAKREKLRKKYAPLVPVFVTALDTIGDGLRIGDTGVSAVRTRFEALSSTLNHPM